MSKKILKAIIVSILIILPIILIILFIFYMNLYRYVVPVTSDNIGIFNELFEINGVAIEIDENVKEVAEVSSDALAFRKYEIVYKNGEVKTFKLMIWEKDQEDNANKLSKYISNNSDDDNAEIWILTLIISIIVSVYLIFDTKKTEIIYED